MLSEVEAWQANYGRGECPEPVEGSAYCGTHCRAPYTALESRYVSRSAVLVHRLFTFGTAMWQPFVRTVEDHERFYPWPTRVVSGRRTAATADARICVVETVR